MARQAADLRVIAEEVALIAVVEGKRMLGPSAGSGALADVCLKFVARQVDCVELEKFCRARLVGAGKVVMIAYFVADDRLARRSGAPAGWLQRPPRPPSDS